MGPWDHGASRMIVAGLRMLKQKLSYLLPNARRLIENFHPTENNKVVSFAQFQMKTNCRLLFE